MSAEPLSLLRLEKTSLRQQALTALRRAITTGELPPGTHLVETDLSDALQISRGTLREAMRQLQQEGLISAPVRAAGCRCVTSTPRRSATSSTSARRWNPWPPVNCARCPIAPAPSRSCARPWRRWSDGRPSNLEDRIEADLKFHRTMCQLTGNETLLHSWTSLEGSIRMSIMFAGVDRAIKNMDVKRHSDIVDAIETGDADTAEATMRDHMASAAQVLVEGAA